MLILSVFQMPQQEVLEFLKHLKEQQNQTNYARQANVKKDSEISILKSEKAVLEVELEETKYQLAVVDNKNEAVQTKYKTTVIPYVIKLALMGKTEMEILAILSKKGLI